MKILWSDSTKEYFSGLPFIPILQWHSPSVFMLSYTSTKLCDKTKELISCWNAQILFLHMQYPFCSWVMLFHCMLTYKSYVILHSLWWVSSTYLFIYSLPQKRSLGAIVKLLSCDLEVMDLSCGNSLLRCKIRLRIIDPMWSDSFPRPRIGRSFCTGMPFAPGCLFYLFSSTISF